MNSTRFDIGEWREQTCTQAIKEKRIAFCSLVSIQSARYTFQTDLLNVKLNPFSEIASKPAHTYTHTQAHSHLIHVNAYHFESTTHYMRIHTMAGRNSAAFYVCARARTRSHLSMCFALAHTLAVCVCCAACMCSIHSVAVVSPCRKMDLNIWTWCIRAVRFSFESVIILCPGFANAIIA